MVLISYSGREINAKLVYYGPGLSGKTTNLESIYGAIPQTHRGKMVSMKTKTERTLFFDFLPIDLGELSGFKTRFLLYTVPGQVYYNATRKLVLKGVDAIVFVADSKRGKMDENTESLQNLRENLREHGLDLDKIPWVIQYNKRDLPDVYTIEELEKALNPGKVPSFEAVGTTGVGVFETFKAISRMLLKHLAKEIGVRVVSSSAGTSARGGSSAVPSGQGPSSPTGVTQADANVAGAMEPTVAPVARASSLHPVAPTIPTVPTNPTSAAPRAPFPPPIPLSPARRLEEPGSGALSGGAEPLSIEPVAPPSSLGSPEPARAAEHDVLMGGRREMPESDPEIELEVGDSEQSFVSTRDEGSSMDDSRSADEAARRGRMGDRLRRWFGRTRDADESEYMVEMGIEQEATAVPAPQPSPAIAPQVMVNTAIRPLPAPDGSRSEPRWREVPILVDLEPEDIERGVVLKLRISVRRTGEQAEDGLERQRPAA